MPKVKVKRDVTYQQSGKDRLIKFKRGENYASADRSICDTRLARRRAAFNLQCIAIAIFSSYVMSLNRIAVRNVRTSVLDLRRVGVFVWQIFAVPTATG